MKVKKTHILQLLISGVPVIVGWYYAWSFVNRFYGLHLIPRGWKGWIVAGLNTCTAMQPMYAISSVLSCQLVYFTAAVLIMPFLGPGHNSVDVLAIAVFVKEKSIFIFNSLRQNHSPFRILGVVIAGIMTILIALPVFLNSVSVLCLLRHFVMDRYIILASPIFLGMLSYLVPYMALEQGIFATILYASYIGTVLKDIVLVKSCLTVQKGVEKLTSDTMSFCDLTKSNLGSVISWKRQGSSSIHTNTFDDFEEAFVLASKLAFVPVIVRLLLGLSWERLSLTYMQDERFKWLFDRPKWHLEELSLLGRKHFLLTLLLYSFEVCDTASVLHILKNYTVYNYEMLIVILIISTSVHFLLSPSGFMYNSFSRRKYSSYTHYQIMCKVFFICQNIVYFSLRVAASYLSLNGTVSESLYMLFAIKNCVFTCMHSANIILLRKKLKTTSTITTH